MAAPLLTVGHSTRGVDELLALLEEHGVQLLVDVRRFPGSRRHPQFAREALAGSLAGAGIGYVHEVDLGGRRNPRPDSPHVAWRVAAFRGYADHMETPPFAAALDRLLLRVAGQSTVVLCAEAVPWRCHRRLIADAVTAAGVGVVHILAPGRTARHELDPAIRVLPAAGGGAPAAAGKPRPRLVYDGGGAAAAGLLPFPDAGGAPG